MRFTTSVVLVFAGMIAGVVLVLSCGDNSPNRADAAVCDCPTAEPPLADRIVVVDATREMAALGRTFLSTACPEGAVRLSGSCTTDDAGEIRNVTLEQSGFIRIQPGGWSCGFKNNEGIPLQVKASVTCLLPAS